MCFRGIGVKPQYVRADIYVYTIIGELAYTGKDCGGRSIMAKESRLLSVCRPDIAKQWHPTLNGELTPDMVTVGSGRKVWWTCEQGHVWDAVISSRAHGAGCRKCSGYYQRSKVEIRIAAELRFLLGVMDTDAGTDRVRDDIGYRCRPDIVLSDYKIAIDIDGSYYHKDVAYRDIKKHERMKRNGWVLIRVREAPLKRITDDDIFCDSLKNTKDVVNKILLELQRLGVDIPDAATYLKQNKLQNQKYADDEIARRGPNVRKSRSLATRHPGIAAQWHPTLNGDLTPDQVGASSGDRAWWRCDQGHVWDAIISNRTGRGSGCLYCSGRRVLAGDNDLATHKPDLVEQWHPTLNGDLTPDQVSRGSSKKAWWRCDKGHVWEAIISSRAHGAGCPDCATEKREESRKNRDLYKSFALNSTAA